LSERIEAAKISDLNHPVLYLNFWGLYLQIFLKNETQKMTNSNRTIFTKLLSVILMCFCVIVVTGINFVLFPETNKSIAWNIDSSGEICEADSPQVPTEEKSSENSTTVHEDFLHEYDSVYWLYPPIPLLHKLMSADKLQVIHYELISPPPDC